MKQRTKGVYVLSACERPDAVAAGLAACVPEARVALIFETACPTLTGGSPALGTDSEKASRAARRLAELVGPPPPADVAAVCPKTLATPRADALAAMSGRPLVSDLPLRHAAPESPFFAQRCAERPLHLGDALALVSGPGPIVVASSGPAGEPVADDATTLDVARALAFPVVLTAPLTHAALPAIVTAARALRADTSVIGVVLTATERRPRADHAALPTMVERFALPVLGVLPYVDAAEPVGEARFRRHVDVDAILSSISIVNLQDERVDN